MEFTDQFSVEFSAYRLAGADEYERAFVPRIEMCGPNFSTLVQLQGYNRPSAMVRIDLDTWTLVRPGFYSAMMRLSDEMGRPVSAQGRPVLLSSYPCDVPLYSNHFGVNPDIGIFAIGMRLYTRAWMPEHVPLLSEKE